MPNSVKSMPKCRPSCPIVLDDRLERRGRDKDSPLETDARLDSVVPNRTHTLFPFSVPGCLFWSQVQESGAPPSCVGVQGLRSDLSGVEIADGKFAPRGRAPLVTFENLSFDVPSVFRRGLDKIGRVGDPTCGNNHFR